MDALVQFLPIIVMFIAMWFILIRPAQKRQKATAQMQNSLKRGDKIMKVNDEVITSTSHLINYVAQQAPSSTMQISIERDGKAINLPVQVGERKAQSQNSDSQYIPLPR